MSTSTVRLLSPCAALLLRLENLTCFSSDLRACALVGVGDDDGGQLHLVEGNALLLAVGQQIVVVVAEHGELAGRLIVACAVAARLGAGAVDFLHLQLVVIADLLHLNVQAGDFQIHVAPIIGFSVYLQHPATSFLI